MTSKTQRIEARFPADLKALAERAALSSGYTLTDYLANLVRNDAPERLKANNQISLASKPFEQFIHACEKASDPSQKILGAARKLDNEGF